MEMNGKQQREFKVNIKHLDKYRFLSQASEDGVKHGEPFYSDEPYPVGDASGPSTPALFAASLGHCLSAALLEALRKTRIEVLGSDTEAVAIVKPNSEGLPRIDRVEVIIKPQINEDNIRKDRCADIFEKYCTVTASVKKGIDVHVNVEWDIKQLENCV